jgi:FkbM family methyltransferase
MGCCSDGKNQVNKMIASNIVQKFFGNFVFTIRTGIVKGMKRRFGFGFKPFRKETPEEKFLKSLKFANKTVFDVGGYVGLYTLFFASAAGPKGKVVAFEPNPVCLKELRANVKLNGFYNVVIVPIAAGSRRALGKMAADTFLPAYSTLSKRKGALLLDKNRAKIMPVNTDTLDNYVKTTGTLPNFVKIDVEGFELEVLQGMKETINAHQPDLFIEIHGENPEKIVKLLLECGYSVYHVEKKKHLNSGSGLYAGHLFCRANRV